MNRRPDANIERARTFIVAAMFASAIFLLILAWFLEGLPRYLLLIFAVGEAIIATLFHTETIKLGPPRP